MNCWIRVPLSRKIVVKNGDLQVQIIASSRPTVRCEDCEFYPTSWRGVKKSEETVFWNFTVGPVKSVVLHKDKKRSKWIRIVWR